MGKKGDRSASRESPKGGQVKGTAPNGTKDRPPCIAHLKGTCPEGKNCNYWHSPPCNFFANGTCALGNNCNFKHVGGNAMPNAAQPKAKEDKPEPKPKAEPKAKAKATASMVRANTSSSCASSSLQSQGGTSGVCFASSSYFSELSDDFKCVRFDSEASKKANDHNRLPTKLKWDLANKDHVPWRTTSAGKTIFYSPAETIAYEELAVRLANEMREEFLNGDENDCIVSSQVSESISDVMPPTPSFFK